MFCPHTPPTTRTPCINTWQTENPKRNNCKCASVNHQKWVIQTRNSYWQISGLPMCKCQPSEVGDTNKKQLLTDQWTANVQVSTIRSGWDKQETATNRSVDCQCASVNHQKWVRQTRNSYWQISGLPMCKFSYGTCNWFNYIIHLFSICSASVRQLCSICVFLYCCIQTQPLAEMSTRNISCGVKAARLTTLPLSCAKCLEIWEPQHPKTLTACNCAYGCCASISTIKNWIVYYYYYYLFSPICY
jgi:hypothetical protein